MPRAAASNVAMARRRRGGARNTTRWTPSCTPTGIASSGLAPLTTRLLLNLVYRVDKERSASSQPAAGADRLPEH